MKRLRDAASSALVALLIVAGAPATSQAATTLPHAVWDAFVAGSDIGRCFPGAIPTFAKALPNTTAWARASDVGKIDLKADFAKAIGSKPLTTKVLLAGADFYGSTMSVERNGSFVAFHLEMPGGDQWGFLSAANIPPGIATGRALPFENARFAGAAGGYKKCGMSLMTATVVNDESGRGIIVRDGRLVGGFESDGG